MFFGWLYISRIQPRFLVIFTVYTPSRDVDCSPCEQCIIWAVITWKLKGALKKTIVKGQKRHLIESHC
jgi:hypothetical protein